MKKKHFVLVLSSLLMASFALGCAPKAPEDRVVQFIDNIREKIVMANDCDKLVKDLDAYCESTYDELTAALEKVKPSLCFTTETPPALMPDVCFNPPNKKIPNAQQKLMELKLDRTSCARDLEVRKAFTRCLLPVLFKQIEKTREF